MDTCVGYALPVQAGLPGVVICVALATKSWVLVLPHQAQLCDWTHSLKSWHYTGAENSGLLLEGVWSPHLSGR
jgi:hypothetical protein